MQAPTPPADDPTTRFFAHLRQSLDDHSFRRVVLARPHSKQSPASTSAA